MRSRLILTVLVCFCPVFSRQGGILMHIYDFFDVEMCNSDNIRFDKDVLVRNLAKVHGQPFLQTKLISLMENHFLNEPRKPLVISMNGWTGVGKTYVSEMIAKSIYRKGVKSRFVHQFSGRLHFPLTSTEAVSGYKIELQKWIRSNVSECSKSLFIFDEVDKISPSVVEAIKPFMDYYTYLNGINFREAIFIFISNAGGNLINNRFGEFRDSGLNRNQMEYGQFESVIRKVMYGTEGIFYESVIIEDHLISLYLPFFPLEKEHVMMCIEDEMERQNIANFNREEIANKVLNEIQFFSGRYSTSGCKRVHDHVALFKASYRGEL